MKNQFENVDPYRFYLENPRPIQGGTFKHDLLATRSLENFYEPNDSDAVCEEIRKLFQAYRVKVCFGLQSHFAPSSTWRDEMMTREEKLAFSPRFVVRVHVFEDTSLSESDDPRPGKYFGFVALRPPGTIIKPARKSEKGRGFRYVVEAELGPPNHMQRPRYHLILTTASSPRLGVLPFRSAVYGCLEFTDARKSACVHLAISQALHLIMGRFGCRPISQIEFDWHLWKATTCKGSDREVGGHAKEDGVKPADALKVVEDSCNGGGYIVQVPIEDLKRGGKGKKVASGEEIHKIHRYLTDTLASGLPVIAWIRSDKLVPDAYQDREPDVHAVLVLGMHLLHGIDESPYRDEEDTKKFEDWHHREELAELPGRVIIHDTLDRGPFYDWKFSEFVEAAVAAGEASINLAEKDGETLEEPGVSFLALGPSELKASIDNVEASARSELKFILEEALETEYDDLRIQTLVSYRDSCVLVDGEKNDTFRDPDHWRIVFRLMTEAEIFRRYCFEDVTKAPGPGRISFLEWKRQFEECGRYFWVMEFHHPSAVARKSDAGAIEVQEYDSVSPALVRAWPCNEDRWQYKEMVGDKGKRELEEVSFFCLHWNGNGNPLTP